MYGTMQSTLPSKLVSYVISVTLISHHVHVHNLKLVCIYFIFF